MAALGVSTRSVFPIVLAPATAQALAVRSELPFSLFVPGGVTVSIDQSGLPGSVADLATAGHWEAIAGSPVTGPKLVAFVNPVTLLRLTSTAGGTIYHLPGQPQ